MSIDPDALSEAIMDNEDLPPGRIRNADAERLLEQAEQLGEERLVTEALLNLIEAYQFSAESDKSLVPFARALRRFDSRPEFYDETDTYTLFWDFKWMTSGMITNPGVGLTAIEDWLVEMARRYREAGHSLDAVHKSELIIAMHLGDGERAERIHRLWRQTERDNLSDCYACDLALRGEYHVERGEDALALEVLAPLLDGEDGCAEQPHNALAESLTPLLRLGRLDEARDHHLRGYRMVRHNESLLAEVGLHVEFCALTGNEARGLEILAEHAKHFDDIFDRSTAAKFDTGAAVLMSRLIALGHGDREVPGPSGRSWTAARLLPVLRERIDAVDSRFDARNGNDVVSRRTRRRLEREAFGPVRLGSGASALAAPRPAVALPPVAPGADHGADDLVALIAEAEVLSDAGRPEAEPLWARIDAIAAEQHFELEPGARAHILWSRIRTGEPRDPAETERSMREAAALFADDGQPAREQLSLLAAARQLYLLGDDETALAQVETALSAMDRLHAEGAATAGQWFTSQFDALTLRVMSVLRAEDTVGEAAVETELERLEAAAAAHPAAATLLTVRSNLAIVRAEVGRARTDPALAASVLHGCVGMLREAGHAWKTRMPTARLAPLLIHLDRLDEARQVLTTALATDDPEPEPDVNGRLHGQLANLLLGLAEPGPALDHALEAAYWYEQVGDTTAVAETDYLAATAQLYLDRPQEAATMLETVVPRLTAEGSPRAADARFRLIQALRKIGEFAGAAEHALTGVTALARSEPSIEQARFASTAAQCLEQASRFEAAVEAYRAAAELWRDLGEWGPYAELTQIRARLRTETADDYEAADTTLKQLRLELAEVRERGAEPDHDELRIAVAQTVQMQAYVLSLHLDRQLEYDAETGDRVPQPARDQVITLAREALAALESIQPPRLAERLSVERQLVFYLDEAGDKTAAVAQARESERTCREAGAEFASHAADFAGLAEQIAG